MVAFEWSVARRASYISKCCHQYVVMRGVEHHMIVQPRQRLSYVGLGKREKEAASGSKEIAIGTIGGIDCNGGYLFFYVTAFSAVPRLSTRPSVHYFALHGEL